MKNWIICLFYLSGLGAWAQTPLILSTITEGETLLYPYAESYSQQTNDSWLKYRILNDTGQPLNVIVNLGYFEQVTLYHYDSAGKLWKQEATGMVTPLEQRGVRVDAKILERVRLEKGENILKLHITHHPNIHLSNLAYSLKRVSIQVEAQHYELTYFNSHDRIFILMFLGAVMLMFLYNTAIYIVLLDRNYLYYISYLFFAGAYFFINKGLYVEWIVPHAPESKLWLSYVALTLSVFFQILFTKRFLELKQKLIWGNRLMYAMLGLAGLVWVCMLLGFYSFLRNFMAMYVIGTFLSMFVVGTAMTLRKHKSAYYYMAGNLGLIVGALIFSLLTMNYLPSRAYTENAGLLGILFEMSFFSLGLASKINETKKELARRSKALIESKNRELEAKVKERTRELQQSNEELTQTLDTVELQHNQIAEKNNKLVSSINYARRIQSATLPTQENIAKHLPQCFTFYQPKDIVSGDFYWFSAVEMPTQKLVQAHIQKEVVEKEILFLVVADCTGHGVPGAFMTILGETLLDQIINRDRIYEPAKVLVELDKRLLKILQQDGQITKIDDGMDIMLMRIDRAEGEICWASAKRSIWVFGLDDDEPTIHKGDKFSIGGNRAKDSKVYNQHRFYVNPTDTVYTFTDGVTDQFGGTQKFSPNRLKTLLNQYKDQDMSIQHNAVAQAFSDWKGDTPQTDDVLLVGLRL